MNLPELLPNSSFSRQLPTLQLAVDSTSLGAFKLCPRFYYYTIVLGYQSKEENVHLVFGILMHSARELYDRRRSQGAPHEDALADAVHMVLKETWNGDLRRGWSSGHKTKNRLTLVRSVVWYLDQYGANDALETVELAGGKPAVELSFRFDSGFASHVTDERWTLCGHLDRIAYFAGDVWISDLKTTGHQLDGYWFSQFSPHNQFNMYMLAGEVGFGVPCKGLIIDGLQVLADGTRFQRGQVQRSREQNAEFLSATGSWLVQMEACAEQGLHDGESAWPMNETSCDKFRSKDGGRTGCEFREVCSRTPQARQQWLAAAFARRVWDPLLVRGDV